MKPCGNRHAFALFVAVMCAGASAQSLDLASVYRLALDQDATIRAARAAADAARERLPQARAQFLPTVSASASRAQNDLDTTAADLLGRPSTTEQRYTSSSETLTVRQPLFRRQLGAQYRQAGAQVADAEAMLERDEQALVVRVAQAYFGTLEAEEQSALVVTQKAALSAQLDAARKGFAAGSGIRTDIDEAQSRLDLLLAQELEAQQNIDLARRQLQVLINRPVFQPLAPIAAERLALASLVPAHVEEWVALAQADSPEMQSAQAQVDAARADLERAEAGHYPTLDAFAMISRNSNENITRINSQFRQKQLGLQLSVPLYQGGYVSSQVREALALLARAHSKMEEARRDLGVRVHREFRGATENALKIRALEQAVRSTEQLAVSSRRSFEAGSRTRLDILNAQEQLGVARRNLAQARIAYVMARIRLQALAGNPRAASIAETNGWLVAP